MAAPITPDAHDDDWTTRFMLEIEQWVRERYEPVVFSLGPDTSAQPSDSDARAQASVSSTYRSR